MTRVHPVIIIIMDCVHMYSVLQYMHDYYSFVMAMDL